MLIFVHKSSVERTVSRFLFWREAGLIPRPFAAAAGRRPPAVGMDRFNQRGDMLGRRVLGNAMPQIEHMPGIARAVTFQHLDRFRRHDVRRSEQNVRVSHRHPEHNREEDDL